VTAALHALAVAGVWLAACVLFVVGVVIVEAARQVRRERRDQ
jgi:hypothetical protein